MSKRGWLPLVDERENSAPAAAPARPAQQARDPAPGVPLSEMRRREGADARRPRVQSSDIAGFGPTPAGWEGKFGPRAIPADPQIDDLREEQALRRKYDPSGHELGGIDLAQAWADDLSAFKSAEIKRYQIDQLVETMLNELPTELWLPPPAAMARSRYTNAQAQTIESPNSVDPTPLRSKLYTMLSALRGEGLDPLLPVGPIWNEALADMVAVDINSDPLTDDETLTLWFLFDHEMKEWARRELAVDESVENEKQRRHGLIAGEVATTAERAVYVTLAASAAAGGGAALIAGPGLALWGTGTTAFSNLTLSASLRMAPTAASWALANPWTTLALGTTTLGIGHDIASGEFSIWSLPLYLMGIRGGQFADRGGGGVTPSAAPRGGGTPAALTGAARPAPSLSPALPAPAAAPRAGGGGAFSAPAAAPVNVTNAPNITDRSPMKGSFPGMPSSVRNVLISLRLGLTNAVPAAGGTGGGSAAPRPVPALVSSSAGRNSLQAPLVASEVTPTPSAHRVMASAPATAPIAAPARAGTPATAIATVQAPTAQAIMQNPTAQSPAAPAAARREHGMTETQHQATRQALGQPFTSQAIRAFANLWDSVANPGEALRLTFVNARRLFNNHRRRFWAAARGDPAVRALLDTMNAQFFGKPGSAPWIVLPDGTRMQLTIDHIIERQTDPMRALSSDNLRLSTRLENTVVLRLLHSLDPFINLPANWSNMPEGGIDISDFDLDPLDP